MSRVEGGVRIDFEHVDGRLHTEVVDYVLAATGRAPNVAGLDLEQTTLPLNENGVPIFSPDTLQAGDSHVFIAGDVNNDRPLLHEATDEGHIAGDNAGAWPAVKPGKRRSPLGIVFSDPQIGMVGQRYRELPKAGAIAGSVSFEDQGRSRVMGKNKGLLRIYAEEGTGRFLGAEMFGPRVEHLAHLLAWAHQTDMTIDEMLEMPFYHPVVEEGLRTALRDVRAQLDVQRDVARAA